MKQIFIVGVGRSGTSLLHSMLAAHPRVAMLPETGFFRRYCTVASGDAKDLSSARVGDPRLQRISDRCWKIGVDEVVTKSNAYPALYRVLLSPEVAACQSGKDPSRIDASGDKDPRLIEYLPLLKYLFPDSCVVHIVRDPRDVLLSRIKADWSRDRNWRTNVLAARVQLQIGETHGKKIYGDRYKTVLYEDLISDPEATLRSLCTALDLEFDTGMLHFSEAAARLSGGTIEPWKRETLGPLLVSNTEKWRTELTPSQTRMVEAVQGSWMTKFGYRTDSDNKSGVFYAVLGVGAFAAVFLYSIVLAWRIRRGRRCLDS